MTDTGGLFYAHYFRQIIRYAIKSTASPKFSKIRAIQPLPNTNPYPNGKTRLQRNYALFPL